MCLKEYWKTLRGIRKVNGCKPLKLSELGTNKGTRNKRKDSERIQRKCIAKAV